MTSPAGASEPSAESKVLADSYVEHEVRCAYSGSGVGWLSRMGVCDCKVIRLATRMDEAITRAVEAAKEQGRLEALGYATDQTTDVPNCQSAALLLATGKRPDTGPMQFGNDWPGVFIRGDRAGPWSIQLLSRGEPFGNDTRLSIARTLASCDVRGTAQESVEKLIASNGENE